MTERTGRYLIPASTHTVEEVRERSRFITTVGRADSIEEARAFIVRVAARYSDATHNCWAFVAGPPGDTSRVGTSDDGEPHGTAGRPMLNVLLGSGVGDVAAVVTRYYGGKKLGRGGLCRAYSGGVKLALEDLPLEEKVRRVECRIVVPYSTVTPIRGLLPEFEAEITSEDYGTEAVLELRLPQERAEEFREVVRGLSSGQARIELPDSRTTG